MQDTLEKDLKVALLAGEKLKVEVLKGLKSAIQNKRIANQSELSDDEIIGIVKKEVKKRHEAAELYEQAGASDRKDKELQEAEILTDYLPKQLTDEELAEVVSEIIEQNGIDSPQKLGMAIELVNKQVGASADGAKIAQLVKQQLGV